MKASSLMIGAFTLMLTAAPALAHAGQDTTTQTAPAAATTAPQPTDKEASDLKRCKGMTAAQRAQSSKCTDLMKKFGVDEKQGDDMMREQALRH